MAKDEPQVTKRRVTMTNVFGVLVDDGEGGTKVETRKHEAVDFVRPDFLDAYVADARTRWQTVQVSEEPDAGPGGYHGQTHVPAHLSHPLAGQTFPETPKADR